MPQTLHGTGGTGREHMLQAAVESFAKGHTAPLGGQFRPETARQLTAHHVEARLTSKSGQKLIICGISKMGDGSVCGG
jgi:hypothetical protein